MNMLAPQNIECSVTLLPPNATKFELCVRVSFFSYPRWSGIGWGVPLNKISSYFTSVVFISVNFGIGMSFVVVIEFLCFLAVIFLEG